MTPLGAVLEHLEHVKRNGDGYTALCPAHDDNNPSLSVTEADDGKVLLKCFAGCELNDILEALGLETRDLFPAESKPIGKRTLVATHDYTDEAGELLFQVLRYFPKKPKGFMRRRSGGGGEWEWSIKGVRRVLYRLPKVLAEAAQGGVVYVCEGEKDAEAVEGAGAVATCNPHGAGEWKDEYSESLRGAHVIVVRHRDEEGHKHAREVAASLEGKAASVTVVEAKAGNDAHDHLSAGHGLDQFVLVEPETEPEPAQVFYAASDLRDYVSPTIEWRVEKLLAPGIFTIFGGKPKAGKTTFILAAAKAVAAGQDFLGKPTTRTRVLYLTEERSPTFRSAVARVGLTGADVRIILRQAGAGWKWLELIEAATEEVLRIGAGLLVVDTLADWAGLKDDSENKSGPMLEALRPLQAAAGEGLAILIGRHDSKGPARELGEAGRGSNAAAGACDILMGLRRTLGASHENRRQLDYLARFDGLPPQQVIEWRPSERAYVLLGTKADIEQRWIRESLLTVVPDDEPATEKDLLDSYPEEDKPPRSTLRLVLGELIDEGEVERTGEGKKGNPYRYSRRQVFPC